MRYPSGKVLTYNFSQPDMKVRVNFAGDNLTINKNMRDLPNRPQCDSDPDDYNKYQQINPTGYWPSGSFDVDVFIQCSTSF
jgi:hypothetical protein